MKVTEPVIDFFSKNRILLGIALAIFVAFVMTFVSLKLYDMNDVSRLDVSLPNREGIRSSEDKAEIQKFSSTGPLDSKALADFMTLYNKNRSALNVLGRFDGDSLSDDSLRIGTNE